MPKFLDAPSWYDTYSNPLNGYPYVNLYYQSNIQTDDFPANCTINISAGSSSSNSITVKTSDNVSFIFRSMSTSDGFAIGAGYRIVKKSDGSGKLTEVEFQNVYPKTATNNTSYVTSSTIDIVYKPGLSFTLKAASASGWYIKTKSPFNTINGFSTISNFDFYIPTTYGSPGQILMGDGIGKSPIWGYQKYYHRTQLSYRDGSMSGFIYCSFFNNNASYTGNSYSSDSIEISSLCQAIREETTHVSLLCSGRISNTSNTAFFLPLYITTNNIQGVSVSTSGVMSSDTMNIISTSTVSSATDYTLTTIYE